MNTICYRDFKLVSNQFILWMLTSDIVYLRDNTVKAFTTLVQRNRNFIQVTRIISLQDMSCNLLLSFQEIFDRNHITDIFTNEIYINKVQVVSSLFLQQIYKF